MSAVVEAPGRPEVTFAAGEAALDAYVARHPESTGYQLSAWRRVIVRAFDHETAAIAAVRGGAVVGVLPLVFFDSRIFGRFVVSMPFLNYGGIVADDEGTGAALLEAAIDETRRRRAQHLELRHTVRRFASLHPRTHKVAMRLPLAATADAQWNGLDRKLRNQVRKADKCGLEVAVGGDDLLDEFYDVFARNMRDLGTPVYDFAFFLQVVREFPDSARVFVVRHRGQPIAGSITYRFRDVVEVPWASSLREFNHLCANVRLYWEMLTHSISRGARTFDFGRSTPDEGTYRFKAQWGAEPVPLVWEYWLPDGRSLPDLSPKNPKYARAIAAWQQLPVGLTRLIGPPLVRNIP